MSPSKHYIIFKEDFNKFIAWDSFYQFSNSFFQFALIGANIEKPKGWKRCEAFASKGLGTWKNTFCCLVKSIVSILKWDSKLSSNSTPIWNCHGYKQQKEFLNHIWKVSSWTIQIQWLSKWTLEYFQQSINYRDFWLHTQQLVIASQGSNNAWSSDMTEHICHLIGHKCSKFQALSGLFLEQKII